MTTPGAPAEVLLDDRYRLLERIATGGMGEVWRAHDGVLHRVVAVKTLKPEHLSDEDFRERFRAEARHAGRLSHSGIASVYDYGESDGRAFLVMELVDGEPLSSLLRREGPLSADRTLDLVEQVAAALHAAHLGGVVHRDVKPGNLLVRPDGVLKVTDFGIASAVDAVPLTQTGLVVGTAYYLSPEQAAGRSATPVSDVYSLGVVAYECLTGARPFPGTSPVAVAMAHLQTPPPPLPAPVPHAVRELVLRALAKDPAARFADARAMGEAAAALRGRLGDESAGQQGGLAAVPVEPPVGTRPPAGSEPTAGLPAVPLARSSPEGRTARIPGSDARSSRKAVRSVMALLAVLAVAAGLRAAGPDQVAAPSGPPPVPVAAADLVGRTAAAAQARLEAAGLAPRVAYDGTGAAVGTVSGVEPTGALAPGTVVLLHVVPSPPPAAAPVTRAPGAVAPAAPAPDPVPEPRGNRQDKGKGKGGGR